MIDLSPRLRVSAFKGVGPGAGLSALKHVEGIMHRFCYASLHEWEETYASHKTCGCGHRLGCRITVRCGSEHSQDGCDHLSYGEPGGFRGGAQEWLRHPARRA